MVNSLVDITLTTLWCDQNCCTSQRFYFCKKELIENLLNQWAQTFFVPSRAKDTGLKDHIHFIKNTSLILMTKKDYNHSCLDDGLMRLFSCYAFKSSTFAYSALSYMCMLSKVCKKKKKNDTTSWSYLLQFAQQRPQKITWHYDPPTSKNCIPFL